MGIAIYPRLATLLEQRHITVADLRRRIEEQFGLVIESGAFDHLTQANPLQWADVKVAGATAAILGVTLGDLFFITTSSNGDDAATDVLDPGDSSRLHNLLDRQLAGALTRDQYAELDTLVAAYGRRLHERNMRDLARQRGITIEEAEQQSAASLTEALTWWEAFQTNPDRDRILAEAAADLQARWPR